MTWYVVCDKYCLYDEGSERDEAAVWTLSENPNEPGWSTDMGISGYGLTRVKAEFLCMAANMLIKAWDVMAKVPITLPVGDDQK